MTADQLFSVLNLITMAAWLPLVFLPRGRRSATVVPVVMPVLLAVIYVALVAVALPRSDGGFSSLAGVRALFDNPWGLLAGWAHYPGIRSVHRRVGGARRWARVEGHTNRRDERSVVNRTRSIANVCATRRERRSALVFDRAPTAPASS